MIKRFLLVYVFFVVCLLGVSCSSGTSTDKGPVEDGGSTPTGVWETLKASDNSTISNTEIQKIISDLSSNVSKLKLYKGSGDIDVLSLKEQDMGKNYSFVYMLGGLSIEGVGAEDYFNMMKLQASDDKGTTFNTKNNYDVDDLKKNGGSYKVNSESKSKVKFSYHKVVDVSETDSVSYKYDGVANFIKLSDELYVVISTLDKAGPKKDESTVASLYSISVISGSSTSVSVYLGMEQKAGNSGNHNTSVKNMKNFFKEDATRSYKNAKNYKELNK